MSTQQYYHKHALKQYTQLNHRLVNPLTFLSFSLNSLTKMTLSMCTEA